MSAEPTSPAANPVPGRPDDLSDVQHHLRALWRARAAIVATAAVLGVAGAAVSLFGTRRFEAVATLSVSASRLNNQTPAPASPEAFIPLMTTQAGAAKVIAAARLDEPTPSELLTNVVTVRAVPNSSLIRVVARLDSAELAATVANRFADEAVAAASRAGRIDVDMVESELKRMLDAAAERLRAAEKAYDDYRTSARFEIVEREVDTLVGQRSELMDVVVELEGERARLARLESDLSRLTPVTALRDSVVNEPALAEAARAGAATSRDLLGLQMQREESNAVYANLNEEASRTRAHVAFLEQRRQRLAAAAGLQGSQLSRLTQFYAQESMLERLNSERRIAQDSYEEIAESYNGSRLAAVGRTPQVLLVDPAVAPDRPLSRYLARNVLLGVSVGALLACVVLLMRSALTAPRGA